MPAADRSATSMTVVRNRRAIGTCPTASNIVDQADGGLARLHLAGGRLTSLQAAGLASLSSSCGNGVVELTNRGNIQLRGIRDEAVTQLDVGLSEIGLDDNTDPVRGLLVTSPLAGVHPSFDVGMLAVAERIGAALATLDTSRLAPKFAVMVDGGTRWGLAHRTFDISIGPSATSAERVAVCFGSPLRPEARTGAIVEVDATKATSVVLAAVALCAADSSAQAGHRMADLVAHHGLRGILDALSRAVDVGLEISPVTCAPADVLPVGVHAARRDDTVLVSAGALLGRLSTTQLDELATLASAESEGELRVTPWRSVLLPHVAEARAASVVAELDASGLVCDPADPAVNVIACSGSTGCSAGNVDTQSDSRELIAVLRNSPQTSALIHVSGCEKRCARPEPTAVTLVGVADGTYDLSTSGPCPQDDRTGSRWEGGLDRSAAIVTAARLAYLAAGNGKGQR